MQIYRFLFLCLMPLISLLTVQAKGAEHCGCREKCATMSIQEGGNYSHALSGEKKYLSLDQIALVNDVIFVELEDRIVETGAIRCDEKGLFIQYPWDLECPKKYDWKCKHCGLCNQPHIKCCQRCDRDQQGCRCIPKE